MAPAGLQVLKLNKQFVVISLLTTCITCPTLHKHIYSTPTKQPDSRDATALAQVLGSTLEEARAGQLAWSDREAIVSWLLKNRRSMPPPCAGLCG